MVPVIVAFPRMEIGKKIKNILVKNGFSVSALCTAGAQVLQHAELLEEGLVICACRLSDMMYQQLRDYLPDSFEMLVIASPDFWEEPDMEHLMCLTMPFKVHELVSAVDQISCSIEKRKQKRKFRRRERSEEEKRIIQDAKELLMERKQITEEEAHRYIQKISMDSGTGLSETAEMILQMMQNSKEE